MFKTLSICKKHMKTHVSTNDIMEADAFDQDDKEGDIENSELLGNAVANASEFVDAQLPVRLI